MNRLFPLAGLMISMLCAAPAAVLGGPQLALPVDCRPGVDCVVQNYVDRGGATPQDFTCGAMTYKDHDGVDFRIPSFRRGKAAVEVRAALAGTVKAVRDGVEDGLFMRGGRAAVLGKECGNGIVVDHSDGWTTQYCHMARGSIGVKAGDRLAVGQRIGAIGLSGMTEFTHLHLTLRQHGKAVDPFAADLPKGACGKGESLWRPDLRASLAYTSPFVLNTGFAGREVNSNAIEFGEAEAALPSAQSSVLVAYVRVIGLKAGDRQTLEVLNPSGEVFAKSIAQPLPNAKAQYMKVAGRRKPTEGWPAGIFRAVYTLERNGAKVVERRFDVMIAR